MKIGARFVSHTRTPLIKFKPMGNCLMKKSIRTALAVTLFVAPLMGCASIAGDGGDPSPETGLYYQDGVRLSPQYGAGGTYVSPGDHTLRLVNGTGGGG